MANLMCPTILLKRVNQDVAVGVRRRHRLAYVHARIRVLVHFPASRCQHFVRALGRMRVGRTFVLVRQTTGPRWTRSSARPCLAVILPTPSCPTPNYVRVGDRRTQVHALVRRRRRPPSRDRGSLYHRPRLAVRRPLPHPHSRPSRRRPGHRQDGLQAPANLRLELAFGRRIAPCRPRPRWSPSRHVVRAAGGLAQSRCTRSVRKRPRRLSRIRLLVVGRAS